MIIKHMELGHTVQFKSPEPRFYKMVNGIFHYSDDNKNWKKSNAKKSAFNDESKWTILL